PFAHAPAGLHQVSLGGVMNLGESVTDRWDLRAQNILRVGSGLRELATATDAFQADSETLAVAVRYRHSPFGAPGYQVALTVGAQDYLHVAGVRSLGVALTAVKRLGQGFDLVGQYQGQWRDGALAGVESAGLPYVQQADIGFIYSFAATFNQHIAPRRSLLNMQHRYLP
ncbi:MAG: hypothetical protein KGR26_13105, partial [Cyanobacteria bacterium REEB65]|nr:hypothetical protein [Cyanobacteria bacterium REEB65]